MDAFIGGAWRSPTSAEAYVSGAWRALRYAEAYIGGAWPTIVVFPEASVPGLGGGTAAAPTSGSTVLTLTASPADVSGTGTKLVVTNATTATPSAGVSPYTYAWAYLSGDTANIGNASSATTAFNRLVGSGELYSTVFRCTCTDSVGATATADVTATFTA